MSKTLARNYYKIIIYIFLIGSFPGHVRNVLNLFLYERNC